MAGWKEYAHEIRKRADDYPSATVQHVAIYAKENNRVYIIDENGALVDFQVADIFCYNIDVSQTAEVGETLSVSGNGYFWSDLNVEDNTYIGGIIDVSGNGYFWSDVVIDGNLLVNSNVAIGENLEVSGNGYFYGDVVMGDNLEVAGNVAISQVLEVSGNSYFYGDVVMGDNLEVAGNVAVGGDVQISAISGNGGNIVTHDVAGKLIDSGTNISQVLLNTNKLITTISDDAVASISLSDAGIPEANKIFIFCKFVVYDLLNNLSGYWEGVIGYQSATNGTFTNFHNSGITEFSGTLNGTTGIDGNISVGIYGSTLYVENRSGSSKRVRLILDGQKQTT